MNTAYTTPAMIQAANAFETMFYFYRGQLNMGRSVAEKPASCVPMVVMVATLMAEVYASGVLYLFS